MSDTTMQTSFSSDKNPASNKKLATNNDQMIDLYSVFRDVAKEWLIILLLTVSAGIFAHVLFGRMRPLQYASTASFAVNNYNDAADLNNSAGADSYSNMNYEIGRSKLLLNILQSPEMKAAVAQDLGTGFSGSITAESLVEANVIEFTVRSGSPRTSYLEAKSVLKNYDKLAGSLMGGTELTVLREPRAQDKPVNAGRNRKYVVAFAGLVFLALCAFFALRSCLSETVRTASEVSGKVDAELLGVIAHKNSAGRSAGKSGEKGGESGVLITEPKTDRQYSEDLRKLAVRVSNEMAQKSQKILLVTSAEEGEGKSTVAANLAFAMAEFGKRVVLVDLDFRRPSQYKFLNISKNDFEDLGTWLEKTSRSGGANLMKGAQALLCEVPVTADLGLYAVLNRRVDPHTAEKHSDLIRMLLEKLAEQADYVILDTSSANRYPDAEELSAAADASLLVVRQHRAEVNEIDAAVESMGGRARMLGCVFNDAERSRIGACAPRREYSY